MAYKKGDKKYHHLNQLTRNYVAAINSGALHEELHCNLRDLLAEAIKMEISLEHLLSVLSEANIGKSETKEFNENVSKNYSYGLIAAKVKRQKELSVKEVSEKKN
jgi:hypothetical protein